MIDDPLRTAALLRLLVFTTRRKRRVRIAISMKNDWKRIFTFEK